MKVLTYYYGANRDNGIGIQAISRELNDAITKNMLDSLSGLHSSAVQDRDNGALMYLVKRDGKSILGLSYTESPSSSGYNRAAPCSIQYVFDTDEMDFDQIGKIVNFAIFKKPDSAQPAPLKEIPVNESGYIFHNKPAALANVIEALTKAALSNERQMVLIALPQAKNSDYTSARYTISEALNCIPSALRSRISFFTGLPVSGDSTDIQAAFDTAAQYGANVIFCSAENLQRLKGHRAFIAVDMDRPAQTDAFAELVAFSEDQTGTLKLIGQTITGKLSYDALNAAAQKVANGEAVTIEKLNGIIRENNKKYGQLEEEYDKIAKKYTELDRKYDDLSTRHERLKHAYDEKKGAGSGSRKQDSKWISMAVIALIAGLLVGGFASYLIFSGHDKTNDDVFLPDVTPSVTESVPPAEPVPTVIQTSVPEEELNTPVTAENEAGEIKDDNSPMDQKDDQKQEDSEEPDAEPDNTDKTDDDNNGEDSHAVSDETGSMDEIEIETGNEETAAVPTAGEIAPADSVLDEENNGMIITILTTLGNEEAAELLVDAVGKYDLRQISELEGDRVEEKVLSFVKNNPDAFIVLLLKKDADMETLNEVFKNQLHIYICEAAPEGDAHYSINHNGEKVSSIMEELELLLKQAAGTSQPGNAEEE